MAEKKTTKAAATKATAEKKAPAKKAAAPKATVSYDVINVGYRAGDVYETLSEAQKALSAKEIAKAAKISEAEVLLGAGWLMKEGKVKGENDTFVLA